MNDVRPISDAGSASERLLEDSWEARARRASLRELRVECTAGLLFLAAVGTLLAVCGAPGFRLGSAALLVAVYVVVARVEFPIGAGHVVPTQLLLVPMLVLLPPAVVPIAAAVALVGSSTAEWAIGRATTRRIVSSLPDAWHAVGPALVVAIAGRPALTLSALPLLAAAFAASCVFDLLSALTRMRLSGLVADIKAPLGVMATVFAVDACLVPVGFAVALATDETEATILCVLPLAALLWLLARDRNQRIEQAHARLKLVEHERTRLQSAVQRLGDAFVAKLQLEALFDILLRGSLEALDADAARLELPSLSPAVRVAAGDARWLTGIDCDPAADPQQTRHGDAWLLTLPVKLALDSGSADGMLAVVRGERRFGDDEIRLVAQLLAKAEIAGAEILDNERVRALATTDALTGLGNRRQLGADLSAALERARNGEPSLLLLFDLDGFKGYNDTFGHLAGDALLARLGTKLADAVAVHGAAYRLGGDEFCALLSLENAEVDDLIACAMNALGETGEQFAVGASLGAVLLPHESDSADHALQLADERMYDQKRGRPTGPRDQARDVLMSTMRAKQPNLDEHSDEVAQLAARVARQLGIRGEALDEITRAAELHDVGKVGIPDAILEKPAALDAAEWEFMHQHTVLGERILNAAPALRPVARLVRSSHERWDGAGYPDKLAGEQIPLGSRIVAVCDAYEAMTADRPYRKALSHHVALAELQANAGSQFDPAVVDAFLTAIDPAHPDLNGDSTRAAIDSASAHIRSLLQPEVLDDTGVK